jgi:hypothetical protein
MPMFQSRTSPLNVPPAIRAGWAGWNDTHIKQLCMGGVVEVVYHGTCVHDYKSLIAL